MRPKLWFSLLKFVHSELTYLKLLQIFVCIKINAKIQAISRGFFAPTFPWFNILWSVFVGMFKKLSFPKISHTVEELKNNI
jgi:hypothetical protein